MASRGFDEVGKILQMRLEKPLHLFTIAEMGTRQLGGGLRLSFYYCFSLPVDWGDRVALSIKIDSAAISDLGLGRSARLRCRFSLAARRLR